MKRFTDGSETVEAFQYARKMPFDDRLRLFKWCRGVFSLELYSDCIVIGRDGKRAKVEDGAWFLRSEDGTLRVLLSSEFEEEFTEVRE